MIEPLYLLDTNILLALVRGKQLGSLIDQRYRLSTQRNRPLVCIVSHGELRVLADLSGWAAPKREALRQALGQLVTVDIRSHTLVDAYVEIDVFSQKHPQGSRNMGKNDLWIAAAAMASGARLLTTDRDFDHLLGHKIDGEWIDPTIR